MSTIPAGALTGARVLDLTQSLGQYATRLLADLGADVIKVEPPGGGEARRAWPFADRSPGAPASLSFIQFNANKRSVVLDLAASEGRQGFLRLAGSADAVVEDFPPGRMDEMGLGYAALVRENPGIVLTSVTPFGSNGPRAWEKGNDLLVQALSGWMSTDGDDRFPPCACPADPSTHLGGMHAALGTLLALRARAQTGRGQRVDVSLYEVMVSSLSALPVARYSLTQEVSRRTGAKATIAAVNYYRCQDGYVAMNIHFQHLWERLVEWMDNPVLNEPYWMTPNARQENVDLCEEIIQEFASGMTVAEFLDGARARGLPVARVNTFKEALADPQVEARGWLQTVTDPALGTVRLPGFPWVFGGTPPRIRRPAPLLGEHTEEVLAAAAVPTPRVPAGGQVDAPSRRLPLEGVRVLDFTRAFAGPFGSRLLADHGAEVIKVESSLFDTQRSGRAGTFTELNRNKLSITLDLHNAEGVGLLKRLAAMSDVVIENFRPGTLERFGLGYEALRRVNPRIVLVTMPAYGSTGPAAEYAAHGTQLIANAGVAYLWGDPRSPMEARPKSTYPDFVAGAQAALAAVAGLHARDATGDGQAIESAQVEALAATLGLGFLDYLVNGRVWHPFGNRRPTMAPHDVYPCLGVDQWCAIACETEEQWTALCAVMGKPSLARDARFATRDARLENADALDGEIGAWTREFTPRQVEHRLQRAGVPAAAFQTGEDVYFDWHLRARGYVTQVDDPEVGAVELSGLTIRLSDTPGRLEMKGRPVLGGANAYVFRELLGLSEGDLRRLEEAKVIA